MRLTYKYKAKISKTTESNAINWLEKCCDIYNACVYQGREAYRKQGLTLSAFDQSKELKDLKQEHPEYKTVGSQVLQNVTERVWNSRKLFFSNLKKGKMAGLPKFKSRKRYKSFTLKNCGWKLDGKHLKIKNVGIFKLFLSRPIQGDIKQITVKRDSCGDWFVFFSCDNVPLPEYKSFNQEVIGIDVGVESFLTDSDGNKVENQRFFKNAERKLRKKQRRLARRKKGSNNRNKARKLVSKQHRKIARQRLDLHFKTARRYVERHAIVVVEKLNVAKMVQSDFAKSINDVGWSQFKHILKFKCEQLGRMFIEVDPKLTSQKCSNCGEIVKKDLSVRTHKCACGLVMDRDENAAINILQSAVGQTVCALT